MLVDALIVISDDLLEGKEDVYRSTRSRAGYMTMISSACIACRDRCFAPW